MNPAAYALQQHPALHGSQDNQCHRPGPQMRAVGVEGVFSFFYASPRHWLVLPYVADGIGPEAAFDDFSFHSLACRLVLPYVAPVPKALVQKLRTTAAPPAAAAGTNADQILRQR